MSFSHRIIRTDYVYNILKRINKRQVSSYNQKIGLSHHPPFPYPEIPSEKAARNFVLHLDDKGRSLLLEELDRCKKQNHGGKAIRNEAIPASELRKVFLFNGVPFIGFGLLDNMIMIVAGEYIDVTLGAALGISTMAAAALGNLISDVAGIGSAGYVELLVSKVGVYPPDMTPAQAISWQSRWSCAAGRTVGIIIGCLLGMFPLFFFDHDQDDASSKTKPKMESKAIQIQ